MAYKQFKDRCSKEEKELAQEIIASGSVHEAYNKLFPEISSPLADYKTRLGSRAFKNKMSELLDRQGLSLADAGNSLKKALNGKRAIVAGGEVVMVDDNASLLEAAKTVYKLHGVLSNSPLVNIDNRKVEFNIDEASLESLTKIAKELDDLNRKMDLKSHRVEIIES